MSRVLTSCHPTWLRLKTFNERITICKLNVVRSKRWSIWQKRFNVILVFIIHDMCTRFHCSLLLILSTNSSVKIYVNVYRSGTLLYDWSNYLFKSKSRKVELWLIVFSFVFSYHFHIAVISNILIITIRFQYHFQSME